MKTENMKKITIGNYTEEEYRKDQCKRCGNEKCAGYAPVKVAFDSSAYIETCDDFISKNASKEIPQFILELRK